MRKHGSVVTWIGVEDTGICEKKQGKLCLLHLYVQFPIEIDHSELEYSFLLWCS